MDGGSLSIHELHECYKNRRMVLTHCIYMHMTVHILVPETEPALLADRDGIKTRFESSRLRGQKRSPG
jgi:hypothetical protein